MCLTNCQFNLCLPSGACCESPRGIAALSAGPESRARQRLPQHCDVLVFSKERRETKGVGREHNQSIADSNSSDDVGRSLKLFGNHINAKSVVTKEGKLIGQSPALTEHDSFRGIMFILLLHSIIFTLLILSLLITHRASANYDSLLLIQLQDLPLTGSSNATMNCA